MASDKPTAKRKIRFHLYIDKDGNYRWRVRSRNGKILADSGEGYELRSQAVRGANLIISAIEEGAYDLVQDPLDKD